MTSEKYSAPALEKGLDILELLAGTPRRLGLGEIGEALGRSSNEIFRMLAVLARRGYLERRPEDDRYGLTTRLLELAMQHPPLGALLETALPEMERLAASVQQACHLAVPSRDEIVVIARVESPAEVGVSARVGHRRPSEASTSGRVLLAFLEKEAREGRVAEFRALRDFDEAGLLRRLEQIRRRGFEETRSAFIDGVTDLSAPVYDGRSHGPVASLTIPWSRSHSATLDRAQVREALLQSAGRISEQLFGPSRRVRAKPA